ncbi:MAG: urease accessory protein UreF [Gammaproteobacteria bacterium]|nr:urease accessory protein UreF [Gammaproteobacteria bacterium]
MQLVSPALPVGAYAYSQGMESAVTNNWVTDEKSATLWILELLENSLCRTDIPIIAKLYRAWTKSDQEQVKYWNRFLLASRESSELQQEDHQLGRSLARLLSDLDMQSASAWRAANAASFATLFTLAATQWQISLSDTCHGYLWSWVENQVAAAVKLVPLGQTAGQRILSQAVEKIPAIVEQGLNLTDDDIGFTTPGLAIASAHHETQYSRLFRS